MVNIVGVQDCQPVTFFFLIFIYLFIYLFLAVLDLRLCARAFCSCGERGPLFIAVRGSLTIAASLVAEHRLHARRLSGCGSRAQLLRGMWDLPRPGLEPVCPALAGRLSTTAPPGKPQACDFLILIFSGDRPSSGCDWLTGSTVLPLSKHLLCVFISGSYHVPLRIEGTHFSTIASAFIVCSIYANGPSGWCELIGFCTLGFHVFENS